MFFGNGRAQGRLAAGLGTFGVAWVGAVAVASSAALANGLFENRPWQFQTSADRANKAIVLDLVERKKGGFFDAFGPAQSTVFNQNTFFNMDCDITVDAAGNVSASEMGALTSSPDIAPGSGMVADSTGNEALNVGGSGPLDNTQTNTGTQTSSVFDNTATVGNVDASGGTTTQVLNNTQDNFGDQHASVNDSTACSIQHVQGGGSANNQVPGN
jgi:hypothetical protein